MSAQRMSSGTDNEHIMTGVTTALYSIASDVDDRAGLRVQSMYEYVR